MEVTWKGQPYLFSPTHLKGGYEKWTKYSNVDAMVFGADTESVETEERYEPQCVTFSSADEDHIYYIPPFQSGMNYLLSWFIKHYFEQVLEESRGLCFMYFHNLSYDLPQLVKYDPMLIQMCKIEVGPAAETLIYDLGLYKVYLEKDALFAGTAAHFTIRIERGSSKIRMMFRDTFSFFPGSLANVAKTLNMPINKMERQKDLGKRDYRTEGMTPSKQEFEDYAKLDSRITQRAGRSIIEMHEHANMTKVKPSAPGFAINMLIQDMPEGQVIVKGSHDQATMQLIFDTYRGGRTGGIRHGSFKGRVYDFHSSYPASMVSLPSFSPTMHYVKLEGDDLEWSFIQELLEETGNMFLRVSGYEDDEKYPAIITTHNGKLTPIYGEFHNIATTGVELMVGVKSGSLTIHKVHEAVILVEMDESAPLPFKEFAIKGYAEKERAEKGAIAYIIAKLKLNAAYGKLIESRHQIMIGADDQHTLFPVVEGMETQFSNFYYTKYLDALAEGETLNDRYEQIIEELLEEFDPEMLFSLPQMMFVDMSLSGRVYGSYAVPAAASLITATSRARLCAFIKSAKASYWDTDSGMIPDSVTDAELEAALILGSSWLPPNVLPLTIGEGLGELDCELWDAEGWLAGTKRYYLDGMTSKGRAIKAAIHGMPAVPMGDYDDDDDDYTKAQKISVYQRTIIEAIATGEHTEYMSKERPLKTKEAKTVEQIGLFRARRYNPKFRLDSRLVWTRHVDHWSGQVIPFMDMPIERVVEPTPTIVHTAHAFLSRRSGNNGGVDRNDEVLFGDVAAELEFG